MASINETEKTTFFQRVADRVDEAFTGEDYSLMWVFRRAIYWIGVVLSAMVSRISRAGRSDEDDGQSDG